MKQAETIPMLSFVADTNDPHFEIKTLESKMKWEESIHEYPHKHNYFELVWIVKGNGDFWIDLQKFDISDHQLFCVKPGQVHQLLADENTKGFIISFTRAFLNNEDYEFDISCQQNLFEILANTRSAVTNADTINDMNEIFLKMLKEYHNSYPFKLQVLKRYLKILLIYFTRQIEESIQYTKQTRNSELVTNFLDLLEKNFKKNKMVAEYAKQLYVTPNYLNEIVKKNTGLSAGYHIRQRIVLEAKRLAHYSNMCMKEIAYSLEFTDSAHFSKFFKTVSGSNFSDFKKEKQIISLVA